MEQEQLWNLIAKKLSGEASTHELSELAKLLRQFPDLHYPVETLTDLWHTEEAQNTEEALLAFNNHVLRMQQQKTGWNDLSPVNGEAEYKRPFGKIRRKKMILASAALVIIFTAGLLFDKFFLITSSLTRNTNPATAGANSEITTRNGSKTNVILPDGSHVWLNAGSKLSYDRNYGNTIREVVLTGEAFFDVVKNADKPFIIHTTKIDIKVLGTRFDVKSYPSDKTTEATLIRGSIEVSFKDRPTEKIILKPNEKIVVANSATEPVSAAAKPVKQLVDEPIVSLRGLTHEEKTGAILETAWVDNKLIFQDESFHDLALQLERWYGVTIQFSDLGKEALRFTGSFENETIQQALKALKLTGGQSVNFDFSIQGNEVIIR